MPIDDENPHETSQTRGQGKDRERMARRLAATTAIPNVNPSA
jgi:hypothetical protein